MEPDSFNATFQDCFCYPKSFVYPYKFQDFFVLSSVQLLSHAPHFATPWIAAYQASLSITNSRSLLKLMSIESMMPSSHFILCRPLLLLPPIPPSIRVFYNESTLHMRWPKYWSFSFSISPSNEQPWMIFRMDWLDLLAVQGKHYSFLVPWIVLCFPLRNSQIFRIGSKDKVPTVLIAKEGLL